MRVTLTDAAVLDRQPGAEARAMRAMQRQVARLQVRWTDDAALTAAYMQAEAALAALAQQLEEHPDAWQR